MEKAVLRSLGTFLQGLLKGGLNWTGTQPKAGVLFKMRRFDIQSELYYVIQRRFHRHYINSQSPETNNNRLRRFIVVAIFVGLTSRIIVSIAATASHEFYVRHGVRSRRSLNTGGIKTNYAVFQRRTLISKAWWCKVLRETWRRNDSQQKAVITRDFYDNIWFVYSWS